MALYLQQEYLGTRASFQPWEQRVGRTRLSFSNNLLLRTAKGLLEKYFYPFQGHNPNAIRTSERLEGRIQEGY